MSKLFLAADPVALAQELTQALDQHLRSADDLTPATIVVPNRVLAQWLTLHLARAMDVLINVRFVRLESALWEWFREVDPRPHAAAPEMLDAEAYQLLVLAVLLEERDAALAPLQDYLGRAGAAGAGLTRQGCRRAWHLAGALGTLIRDYEYHRQEEFIQPWLRGEPAAGGGDIRDGQRAQQAIFAHIVREPDGRRARLNQATGRNFKTLPQYVMEVMELALHRTPPRRVAHVFGLTQISALHVHALSWLTRFYDLRVYGLNPLATRLPKAVTGKAMQALAAAQTAAAAQTPAQTLGQGEPSAPPAGVPPGDELLRAWGRAGAESLHLAGELLAGDGFKATRLASTRLSTTTTVLETLHAHLLGAPRQDADLPSGQEQDAAVPRAGRVPQDRSLQIVGCPGVVREVETVHNSILQNLHDDPTLRLSDIAVLVTDMPRYRPALQAVFDRLPRAVPFSLIDFSAAGASAYGKALLGMLDLALESFTRSRVFEVLHNPCFTARLGITPQETAVWERWADALGIHEGWDAAEKGEAGLPPSSLYSWRLALRRLRLGRCMEATPEDHDGPAARFGDVVPYADIDTGDREQLAIFCQTIEGLLPALAALRKLRGTGRVWAERLRTLMHEFLEAPADRPEEAEVRDRLAGAAAELELWDGIAAHGLPLALVRELIAGRLADVEARRGRYLAGGVTIAALQPMRPVPFRVIYVLGLNEDCFPGSNQLSMLDLRRAARRPGDIRPAEHQRFLFLETLVAAREKLYLLYSDRDVQRDQRLLPAVPVQQLQRWLSAHVTAEPFAAVAMPLYADDGRHFDPALQQAFHDVMVQHRPAERLAALADAERRGLIAFNPQARRQFDAARRGLCRDFSLPRTEAAPGGGTATLRIHDLRRFLRNPAEANLKRHLRLSADDREEAGDFEPLVTGPLVAAILCRQVLERLVIRAGAGELAAALDDWPRGFAQRYDDLRLRCRAPEAEFAQIDEEHLRRQLHERIHGSGGLADFLAGRVGKTFCGPILVGENITPLGPRLHLPALVLDLPAGSAAAQVRITGYQTLAWYDAQSFEMLLVNSAKEPEARDAGHLAPQHLGPLLFYLVLLASKETDRSGRSGRLLVEGKSALLHIAGREAIETIPIAPGLIAAAEAEEWLGQIAAECLLPTCCDHLPFEAIATDRRLRAAYEAPAENPPADYAEWLEDALTKHASHGGGWIVSELLQALDPPIPEDACVKMRRRFELLDRPLAALRAAQPEKRRRRSETV